MIKTSLIISTYNQEKNLRVILESAKIQTNHNFEIVIADDGSSDGILQIIENFRRNCPNMPVEFVTQEDDGFRKTMILNKAINKSTGEYLIFIDGDMILEKRFIELHLRYKKENQVLCGYRGVKLNQSYSQRVIDKNQTFSTNPIALLIQRMCGNVQNPMRSLIIQNPILRKLLIPYRNNLSGCNFSLYRTAIEKVNGFNEDVLEHGFNDYELGHRFKLAGYRLVNVSKLCNTYHLYHPTRKTRREEVRKKIGKVDKSTQAICVNGLAKLSVHRSKNDTILS